MANFGQKPWTNPFGKISIFRLFEVLLFIASKGVFFALEYHKTHFLSLDCPKKKDEKKANFRPKPWTNQFGKISIFRLLELLFFYSLQRCFFALEYHKTHFPGVDCLKKRDEKMANFGPKPWTNQFGKISIFRLFELLFFL